MEGFRNLHDIREQWLPELAIDECKDQSLGRLFIGDRSERTIPFRIFRMG